MLCCARALAAHALYAGALLPPSKKFEGGGEGGGGVSGID
jgi:hypothetical protein